MIDSHNRTTLIYRNKSHFFERGKSRGKNIERIRKYEYNVKKYRDESCYVTQCGMFRFLRTRVL